MEEELLIKKAQDGEAEAFGQLYDQYLAKIYRFVFIKVSSQTDAEDLTQQIFLNAWQNIKSFQFQGFSISSWFYRIAYNEVIDFYRTRKHHETIETLPEEILSESPGTDRILDQNVEIEKIKAALQKLEGDQQNVLLMKFVDDLSNKEIAQILNKSEGAIRVIQHRALKQLKEQLNETRNYLQA